MRFKRIKDLREDHDKYQKEIAKLVDKYVYNLGKSGEVGAQYIIEAIQRKIDERRKMSKWKRK